MQLEFSREELAFQKEVRDFLDTRFPDDLKEKVDRDIRLAPDDYIRWQRILNEKGWMAPNWPVEYGGTGWTPTQKYIFEMEMGAIGAPEPVPFGVKMVAPVIIEFGNTSQKQRFLPEILESRVWWCQGYSEPNAGSDLASLKTSATRVGDNYIVNGTKTWNTYGQYADWIFCLVRTDRTAKKQEGISFLLIDMRSPGVSVNPIVLLDGHAEVNEVVFDNVTVPVENLVGLENEGWTYAKFLLTHERTNITRVHRTKRRLRQLKQLANSEDSGDGTVLGSDPIFAIRLAELEIQLLSLEFAELRTLAAVSVGKAPGPESSILKVVGTEIAQEVDELFLNASGYLALAAEYDSPGDAGENAGSLRSRAAGTYFNNRKLSIFGGSNEIQKNIISKAVLGL